VDTPAGARPFALWMEHVQAHVVDRVLFGEHLVER
jgi:hypothetical protein